MSTVPHPPPPDPTLRLTQHAWHQLVHTLCSLLPPPLDDTPEALAARNEAAIAKVAAMLPVNAEEADLAAHCVAARAQAEDALRLIRAHSGDIAPLLRLNAQFALMERTANACRALLLRVQTARHRREADQAAASSDAWAGHIAARQMQHVLQPGAEVAMPEPAAPPEPAPPAVVSAARWRGRGGAEAEAPVRDLAEEADFYAITYPRRALLIRQRGGPPPGCDFGPPDPLLVRAIVTGNSPTLRALDAPAAAA